jgi:glucose/arabinose dehydrogenase
VTHLSNLSIAITILALAACSSDPAETPAPGGGTSTPVTGQERVAWDQPADSAAQLAEFGYAIYVDGARSLLADVSCSPGTAAQSFTCSGKGPDLPAGPHTLEVAAFTSEGESPRSSPLAVTVTGGTTATAPAGWPAAIEEKTADGVSLRIDKLADGFSDPVDAAFLPDGRLLIAERQGRIRVVQDGQLQASDALTASSDAQGVDGVLSIAIDPDFERTHFVFAVLAARTGSGDVFRLNRYRELRGTLAERAVLIEAEGPPVSDASAVLRVSADGKLYLAVGAAGFPGRLLRLNLDGTMPRDQAGTQPAVAQGLQTPRGLALDPRSGIAWIADEQDGAAHLSGVSLQDRPLRAVVRARYGLAGGAGASTFYSGTAMPGFDHALLVASPSGRHIEKIRFSDEQPDRIAATETLLQDVVGPIDVVTVGPDGAIYFCAGGTLGKLTHQ